MVRFATQTAGSLRVVWRAEGAVEVCGTAWATFDGIVDRSKLESNAGESTVV